MSLTHAANPETSSLMHTPARRRLFAILLFILTIGAYFPALHAGFIWDDDDYVHENPHLLDLDGLARIWTPQNTPQYYPVVFTTFWIEHHLYPDHPVYGTHPFGYHLVNVLLHALNAWLLWLVLTRLGVAPGVGWTIAALFALHPVHVESAAWITERKNVLSLAFALLAALAYLRFDRERTRRDEALAMNRDDAGDTPWTWYAASLLLFACALLSKSVTASLPIALALIHFLRRDALTARRLAPLAVFLLMGAAAGLHTAYIERVRVGAVGPDWDISFIERMLIAARVYLFYPWKILCPWPLIFIYPRWEISATDPRAWLWLGAAGALVMGVLITAWRAGRRGVIVALLFYSAAIFPALGFANVYPMRFSFVADHFQYHASIGMIALIVAAGAWLLSRCRQASLAPVVAGALLAVSGGITFVTTFKYKDAETLWRVTAERNPAAWIAHTNLSRILLQRSQSALDAGDEQAIQHLAREAEQSARRALEHRPDHDSALTNLAEALRLQGRLEEAVDAMRASIASLERQLADFRTRNAVQQIRLTIDTLGTDHLLLGRLHELTGRLAEAEAAYLRSHELNPRLAVALDGIGRLAMFDNRLREAALAYEKLLALVPHHVEAMLVIADYNLAERRDGMAARWLERALETTEESTAVQQAVYRLAWLRATSPDAGVRNGAWARQAAIWLVGETGQASPYAYDALAAANAELGLFDEARLAADAALTIARAHNLAELISAIEQRQAGYQRGEPFRDLHRAPVAP